MHKVKLETHIYRVHVFADLKPYICTFPSCSDELCMFPTRRLWADHEFRKHRVEKSWRCYLCPIQLPSPGLWREHVKQVHRKTLSSQQAQKAISMAEFSKELSMSSQTCPMCQKAGISTRKEFVTHVAKHMESISLAVLPRDTESDSGSYIASGSTHSDERHTEVPSLILKCADETKSAGISLIGNESDSFSRRNSVERLVNKDQPGKSSLVDGNDPPNLNLDKTCHIKPPYSSLQFISQAILESPDEHVSLNDIHNYCEKKYAFCRQPENILGWRVSEF